MPKQSQHILQTDFNEKTKAIEKRKKEHLQFTLTHDVIYKQKTNLLEYVYLLHNALPDLDRNEVNTEIFFLRHQFTAPFMIAGMTGGAKEAAAINKNIAQACQKLKLGMGLGSMKAMIIEPSLSYSYQVRDVAPDIFLAGNIGANDLKHFPIKTLKETLKKLGADILAVHLNPAQELAQSEGKAEFAGVFSLIQRYAEKLPIYVKEVGQGISQEVAEKLSQTNIKAIDVGGAGGTNWIKVEYLRQGKEIGPLINWGIPTALSILLTKKATKLPIIATGGIRNGEDIVKSIILGANLTAIALPILHSARDPETVTETLKGIIKEIGDIMFLIGAGTVREISKKKYFLTGELKGINDLI